MTYRVFAGIAIVISVFACLSNARGDLISPTAAPYYSGEAYSSEFGPQKAFDNDWNTQAAIKSDGSWTAGEHTTGHIVFDLGEVHSVVGSALWGWEWTDDSNVTHYYNPKDVTFYASNANGEELSALANHSYSQSTRAQSESTSWAAISTRYVGLKVNSSYAEGSDGHWNYQISEIRFETVPTPEPSTIVLAITGFVGLLCYAWRKRK
jgi:hypothetical protein